MNFFRHWSFPATMGLFAVISWTIFLGGCDKTPMERKVQVDTVTITWIKETPQSCGPLPAGHILNACASNSDDYSRCTIRMPEDTPDWVVAEEFKHCFGWVHYK